MAVLLVPQYGGGRSTLSVSLSSEVGSTHTFLFMLTCDILVTHHNDAGHTFCGTLAPEMKARRSMKRWWSGS